MRLLFVLAIACQPPTGEVGVGDPDAPGNGDDSTTGDDPGDDPTEPDPEPEPEPVAPVIEVYGPPALDPLLSDGVELEITSLKAVELNATLLDADDAVVADLGSLDAAGEIVTWDGRDDAGELVPTGTYRLAVSATSKDDLEATAEHAIEVVRVGFVAAWAEDDAGLTAQRHPLYWAWTQVQQDGSAPIASLDALEDGDGLPQDFPAVGDNLVAPQAGATEPVAYTWDDLPILSFELGADSVLGPAGVDEVDLTVAVPGWTLLSAVPLDPTQPVVLQADAPLAGGPSVVETTLEVTFSVQSGESTWPLGSQAVPLRAYLLLDTPDFPYQGVQYSAWTAAIDPALRAIDGVAPDADAVSDAVVEWVFYDQGLIYDTTLGASRYSEYGGGWSVAWDETHFDLTDYLQRGSGSTINCSDASSIVGTFSTMLGARLDHIVILEDFELNEISAIGTGDWTSCPFGPWSFCGFSYHAVATSNGGGTIWDATLALDGDANPGQSPSTTMLVQSLTGDEYLDRLVRSGDADYFHASHPTIQ